MHCSYFVAWFGDCRVPSLHLILGKFVFVCSWVGGSGVATRGGMQAFGEPSSDGVARCLSVAVVVGDQGGQHQWAQEESVWL